MFHTDIITLIFTVPKMPTMMFVPVYPLYE